MAVYLIQHITNNKSAIDLAIAFYSKLQLTLFKKCISYWVDKKKNSVFYLIKAPNKKSIKKLYYKSINLCPYKITLVNSHLVYAFLKNEQQLKMLLSEFEHKPQKHTVLLVQKTFNKKVLFCKLKESKIHEVLSYKKTIIKNLIHSYGGNQIKSSEESFIVSFSTFKKAFDCSLTIQKKLHKRVNCFPTKFILYPYTADTDNVSISRTIDLLYLIKSEKQLIIPSQLLKTQTNPEYKNLKSNKIFSILASETENFLLSLLDVISNNFHNPNFTVSDISSQMMMCKTTLYRNCKAVTGKSINQILKEYRLLKSINSITSKKSDINQTSIEVGFNSLSYFSNCFKKKFGITPTTLLKHQKEFNLPYYL